MGQLIAPQNFVHIERGHNSDMVVDPSYCRATIDHLTCFSCLFLKIEVVFLVLTEKK